MNMSSIQFLPVELCFLLVVGGMAVGCLGGLVAAWNERRFASRYGILTAVLRQALHLRRYITSDN